MRPQQPGTADYGKKGESYILEISEQKSNVLRKGKFEDEIMVVAYNKTLNMTIPYLSMDCFLKDWEIIG